MPKTASWTDLARSALPDDRSGQRDGITVLGHAASIQAAILVVELAWSYVDLDLVQLVAAG
ncbi:hypothetical protein [Chelativorans sp. M5D2P16]|uniref:hypothetical protein n=1 Tax=Chelativorans sp. M5D2P16 TaxID=3095678 RepID=UPI002ACA3E1C|nr:hypothetical protein [Chelativorans sp. M5D2P16]MDZ5696097.1 hypothetical protein [Chelativorans sp. M5D2P16]